MSDRDRQKEKTISKDNPEKDNIECDPEDVDPDDDDVWKLSQIYNNRDRSFPKSRGSAYGGQSQGAANGGQNQHSGLGVRRQPLKGTEERIEPGPAGRMEKPWGAWNLDLMCDREAQIQLQKEEVWP